MRKHECCNENGKYRCSFWKCVGWGFLGVIGFAGIAVLAGLAIMYLWNWTLPGMFHFPVIGFCQAIGLAILSRLLFGGCGGGFRHMHRKHHGHRCGGCGCGSSHKECCNDTSKDDGIKHEEAPQA